MARSGRSQHGSPRIVVGISFIASFCFRKTPTPAYKPRNRAASSISRIPINTGQICRHCASGNSGSESGNRHPGLLRLRWPKPTRAECRKTRQDQIRRTDNYFAKAVSRTKNRCNDGLIRHKSGDLPCDRRQHGKRDQRKQDADQNPNCQAVLKLQRLLLALFMCVLP